MHLTTLISLLAVGAAAAPAASLDLNTRMARPTMSNLDLPEAPEITNLVRRQEAEDPVEETPEESSSSSSFTAAGLIPELPTLLRRQEPVATKEPSVDSKDAAETENDPLEAYLHALDGEGEYVEKAYEKALDRYHASLEKAKSNSTTSAVTTSTSVAPVTMALVSDTVESTVPVDTKNVTSTDFDWKKLAGMTDALKKDVESFASTATNETSTEHPAAKNVTDTAAPVTTATQEVDSEKLVGKTETAKNETSTEPIAKKNETTSALPEPTKNSDPLAMLSGLLPVKRNELSGLSDLPLITKRQNFPRLSGIPNVEGLESSTKRQLEGLTGAAPKVDAEDLAAPDLEELESPIKRQLERLAGATPKVDEEDVPAPDVKEDDITPTVDEKVIDSNATAVNSTAADASTTSSADYANINKHMDKLSKIPLGLPVKRQAPEFSNTPVAAPEIADDQPTGGLPAESQFDADSPLHKFLVPLHR
jgi:hypothetical protein